MSKADAIVFHYNKTHNTDPTVPPWVVKCRGQSHYVTHIDIEPGVGFSTKETPDNPHTKASIKLFGVLTLSEHNEQTEAKISPLPQKDCNQSVERNDHSTSKGS